RSMAIIKHLYLLLLLVLFASCSNYYYAPNSHNVPLFKSKDEARVDIKGIMGDDFGGGEIQGAYSLADNIGVVVNGIYGTGGSILNGRRGSGYIGEVGVGYFNEVLPNLVAEIYGGAGVGSVKNRYSSTSG